MRLGTPALTTRGFVEADFERVANILDRTLKVGLAIQTKARVIRVVVFVFCGQCRLSEVNVQQAGKKLEDFIKGLDCDEVRALREEVHAFARSFPMPGLGF